MKLFSKIIRQIGPLGVYAMAQRVTASVPKILMYHRFSEVSRPGFTSGEHFARQLDYLQEHFTVISIVELVKALENEAQLPANAVVVTIDDGYEDFYSIAFPLLKARGLPATLFVTTGFVNSDLWLWPDQVDWILNQADEVSHSINIDGLKLDSARLTDSLRPGYWGIVIDYLLSVPDIKKHQIIAQLARQLGVILPVNVPVEYRACNWDQLLEMQGSGIEIGGHTVTHPSLGRVSLEQARTEIEQCGQMLSENLGQRLRPFCYPNGTVHDFNDEVKEIVAQSGFAAAVTAFDDCLCVSDRYAIRRFPCGDDMFQFYKSVSGVQHLGNVIRQKVVA